MRSGHDPWHVRLNLDGIAGRRFASGEESHDGGIAVEVEQVVHVGLGEAAENQAPGFEEDLHRSSLRSGVQRAATARESWRPA